MTATCGSEGYCVDDAGNKLERSVTFETQFDGDALDSSVFGFETGFAIRNDDDEFFTDRVENAFVADGELVLVARAEDYQGASYTSASIETKGKRAFTYGRIEAEIRFPTGTGVGPSFWMLPEEPGPAETSCAQGSCMNSTWPVWGDVVIAALHSEDPKGILMGANYASEQTSGKLEQAQSIEKSDLGADASVDFHVFGVDWGPERIDWFIDQRLVRSLDLADPAIYHPQGLNPFQHAFQLKLALAVGGLAEPPVADQYPQELRVRWLRVSQYQ
jgi:beta-glucanase (GH16 family)